ILASEDIGLADPMGIVVASAAAQNYEMLGMPEGAYPIAHATLYLATAPKSNTVGAYFDALAEIEKNGAKPVPTHLMDASRDSKAFGHGQGYKYPHAFEGHWVKQQYLPDGLESTRFYTPSDQGAEIEIARRLSKWRDEAEENVDD
ncbi:MAG TPA: replication-associated recombination protein A, partial [Anaerolineaceae bacterium]|nr:replication-associated recombination protein A [Anaerolineaceae bacterium]